MWKSLVVVKKKRPVQGNDNRNGEEIYQKVFPKRSLSGIWVMDMKSKRERCIISKMILKLVPNRYKTSLDCPNQYP